MIEGSADGGDAPRVLILSWYGPGRRDAGERIRLAGITSSFAEKMHVAWALVDSEECSGLTEDEAVYLPERGVRYRVSSGDYLRATCALSAVEAYVLGRDRTLRRWVQEVIADFNPDTIWVNQPFVWSLVPPPYRSMVCVDTHNVNSARLRRIARSSDRKIAALGAAIQSTLSRGFERKYVLKSGAVVAVSEEDRAALVAASRSPVSKTNVLVVGNGTELVPDSVTRTLGTDDRPSLLFLGSLGYSANMDGLERLRDWLNECSIDVEVAVVGSGDAERARAICSQSPNLRFVGYVSDPREEMQRHHALIAPHSQGGGSRIKVLEALATRLPVIGTKVAVEGLGLHPGVEYLPVEGPSSFVSAIDELRSPRVVSDLVTNGWQIAEMHQWMDLSRAARECLLRSSH